MKKIHYLWPTEKGNERNRDNGITG